MQGAAALQNNQYTQLGNITSIKAGQLKNASDRVDFQQGQINAALGDTVDAVGDFFITSDRRLKKDIKLIGLSPSGLNIYQFKYKDSYFGKGLYEGVMADEMPLKAVIKHKDGYNLVDYNKIDVDFKTIIY